MNELQEIVHDVDLCVVGGGIGGLLTAIAAARRGAKVALMHDRPVLGGNASSEIRMWICGAGTRVRNLQETGIMEEIALDNMARNPSRNWSLWDALLYEKARFEPNIDLILNCACSEAEVCDGDDGGLETASPLPSRTTSAGGEATSRAPSKDHPRLILSVTGFQPTTQRRHKVRAKIFADCSGDSILAPLTGAEHRVGREAKAEFGEEFGIPEADRRTMGSSLLIQARETDHPVAFTPPPWAYSFPDDEALNHKPHECLLKPHTNFYWIELGGEADTIADAEELRDELLKIAFGVWDHMKNHGDHGAANWELEWVGFLPGKRESRRYVGDYTLVQNDVENGGKRFEDVVAYGGWQIDNHLPGGVWMKSQGGAHLQKRLMDDDCFLPGLKRELSPLARDATLVADYGDASDIASGVDRRIWGRDNGYFGKTGKAVAWLFDKPTFVGGFRLVCDSDLDRENFDGHPDLLTIPMPLFRGLGHAGTTFTFPRTVLKAFRVEAKEADGSWTPVFETASNHQRLVRGAVGRECLGLRLVPLATWGSALKENDYGSSTAHVFAFDPV